MTIRAAQSQDLQAIAALEAACFPPAEAATPQSLEQRLKVFADGLQDYRLLKALETRKGRAFVTELLDRFGYLDFFTYPHDGVSLLRLHDEACRLLCDTKE